MNLNDRLKQFLTPARPIGAVRAEVTWRDAANGDRVQVSRPNLHVRYFGLRFLSEAWVSVSDMVGFHGNETVYFDHPAPHYRWYSVSAQTLGKDGKTARTYLDIIEAPDRDQAKAVFEQRWNVEARHCVFLADHPETRRV